MKLLFGSALFSAITFLSISANAYNVWDATQCESAISVNNFGPSNNTEIFVYVENDFAAEMTSCTPRSDDAITENDVRSLIEETMEKWNQQSTGATFHYGGIVTDGNPTSACAGTQMPKRPAVLVNFRIGCKDFTGACQSGSATVSQATSDCGGITVWGDPDSLDSCDANAYNWNMDARANGTWANDGRRLRTALLHEFGHMQEIGHPTGDPANSDAAIMLGPVTKQRPSAGHLLSYDKDCALIEWRKRSLEYNHMWALDSYEYYGAGTHSYPTARGFASGGAVRTDPYDNYDLYDPEPEIIYGLYTDHWLDYGIANSIGYGGFTFSSWNSLDTKLTDAHVMPTLSFHDYEHSSLGRIIGSRMVVHQEGYAAGVYYEPPRLLSGYSTDLFSGTSQLKLTRCTNSTCSSSTQVKSHLPLAITYDPESDLMITVRVDTAHVGNFQRGSIWVHPGFYSTSKLNQGSKLSSMTTQPPSESHPFFEYAMETELPLGVACTSRTDTYPFNCLLAWSDRGIYNGRILYTYFRVGSNGGIDWHPNSWARSGSQTNSGVQAAYGWERFRMTWKKRFGADTVEYTSTMGDYTSWTWPQERSAAGIVDIPTYLYHHLSLHTRKLDRNHAIVWTAADISDN